MQGIQVRKGAILLWRLGQFTYGEQSNWDRAPQKKGMWSFPWPFYDPSFTSHQYSYYMPKRLSTNGWGDPIDVSWYQYPDGTKPESVKLDEYGIPEDWELTVPQDFYEEQRAWIRDVGQRILPLRKFWYHGELFTHFPRVGFDSHDGYDYSALSDWYRVSGDEAARRLRKGAGQLAPRDSGALRMPRRGSVGMLELFIPPNSGRIS